MISIAMGILLTTATITGAANSRVRSSVASSHENFTEQALTLENWMVNDCYWNCLHSNCLSRDYDQALTLDAWMTELNNWDYAVYLPNESDKPLQVEPWMTGETHWSGGQPAVNPDNDQKMQLESWMTDPGMWKRAVVIPSEVEEKISLESWMTDDHVWSNEYSEMVFIPATK